MNFWVATICLFICLGQKSLSAVVSIPYVNNQNFVYFDDRVSLYKFIILILHDICFKQVLEVVKKTESLKKISFLAHSLGGLIARYAVAVLYSPNASSDNSKDIVSNNSLIAGLEAINFITLATPHLGVRGKKQV